MLEIAVAIALVLCLALAVVLIRASRQPDTFSYARSTVIDAPPERIFPLIADPPTMNTWNPFNECPSIKGSYSGPEHGPGARYTFASRKAGTGYTEIVEEEAPRRLGIRLVMTKPMACDNRVEFRLEPSGRSTRVTWAMTGPMTFMGKVMNQVIDCEKMCGTHFERGLAKLKGLAERQHETA
ncbi:MAG: SRPBCC family protein [Hyphomicrobiaceae bacterium]